jgi:hypothetical protein
MSVRDEIGCSFCFQYISISSKDRNHSHGTGKSCMISISAAMVAAMKAPLEFPRKPK